MNPYRQSTGFNVKTFLIVFGIVILVLYGLFNSRFIILGPTLEIYSPTISNSTDLETKNKILDINGKAENIVLLTINQKPISVDKQGFFDDKLLLLEGFNTIEIRAKDRFKNEKVINFRVYYKPIEYSNSTTTNDSLN